MKTYAVFTENNDHEGETWKFYLQYEGNEAELDKLYELVGEDDEVFHLDLEYKLSELDVEVLLKHGGWGYMDYHNKVDGVFTCPVKDDKYWFEDLGKGGITYYFK